MTSTSPAEASTVRFEVGKTYYTRSACDHNCIYTVKVLGRTAKTIKALVDGRDIKTLRPSIYRNAEQVKPHGSYSMAAIVDATDTKELRRDWEKAAAPELRDDEVCGDCGYPAASGHPDNCSHWTAAPAAPADAVYNTGPGSPDTKIDGVVQLAPVKRLTCAVCGALCRGRQWHNRDTGFGLCGDCVVWLTEKRNVPAEEMQRNYGTAGQHYNVVEARAS